MRYDLVIAGAGLAGACAAFNLARTRSVLILETAQSGSGASGAAAGLVNPFLGQKSRPAWRHRAAMGALLDTLAEAGARALFRDYGVLRPARDPAQAAAFRATAEAHLDADWLGVEAAAERVPGLVAPHGALWIPEGGAIDLTALVEALLAAAVARGAVLRTHTRLTSWGSCIAITDKGERIAYGHLLLALGDGFRAFPALSALPLHRIKGQVIGLARPDALAPVFPALSGDGYVVPTPEGLTVGATFEHEFADLAPTEAASRALRARAARMLPALRDAPILDARAGVRVTVPGVRLPLLGPLPGEDRVWVFTGLGAKGLLTAPLLARDLPGALDRPGDLPPEVSTRRLA